LGGKKLLSIYLAINVPMVIAMILEGLSSLVVRYIHFFSSIAWWGMMFFMFIIIFPANKDGSYSTLFPRVQTFMKVIASVAVGSGIMLLLFNRRFSVEYLFGSGWGYAILTGATISLFVYVHILMQNRTHNKTNPITEPSVASPQPPSSLLIPSTSISLNRTRKNPEIMAKTNSRKKKTSKRFIPWLLFILLTVTVGLMVYASHGF
jgi:hypothetical protein